MRVLFCTTAGVGHFGPLVPLARACLAAGHAVAVAAPGSFHQTVTQAGFCHLPLADPPPEQLGAVYGRLPTLPVEEANELVVTEIFGRIDAQAALPAMTLIVNEWRPDVVVREPCEFASLVAADRAGIAQVQVAIGMRQFSADILPMLSAPLAELSELAGLAAGRGSELQARTGMFTSVPAWLDGEDDPRLGSTPRGPVWRFRDSSVRDEAALPSPWGDPADPLVYVSFGSVAASLGPFTALYSHTLSELADLPVRVLLTTGRGLDPAALGPLPRNARVETWWAQEDVMPAAAAAIGHGGFGTTMSALSAGVPQLAIPLFASDQFINADRVAAVGAGIALSGGPGAAGVADALRALLDDPGYRSGARAVAAEIAALPDVASCLPILAALSSPTGKKIHR